MTMWAMLLVEFVHPLMQSMQREGALEGCKDCVDAASSVMHANLLLFKTVGAPKKTAVCHCHSSKEVNDGKKYWKPCAPTFSGKPDKVQKPRILDWI